MARPLYCARCDKVRIGRVPGVQVCTHCRLLFLHYVFYANVDEIRLNAALSATKVFTQGSEKRCWQVITSRMRRGEQPDDFLVQLYKVMNTDIPEPSRQGGGVIGYLKPRSETVTSEADDRHAEVMLKKARKMIKQMGY